MLNYQRVINVAFFLAFVSGMNALNARLVEAHWHDCSIETMPTYILYIQTFFSHKRSAQITVLQVALRAKQAL
jgi:hypothetical protein